MENIAKVSQELLQTFLEWFASICHPYLTCDSITSSQLSSRDKMTKSIRIWITSYFIALIVQIPLYRFVGIDLKDLTFLLPNTLIFLLGLIMSGSLFHIALKLRKIHSDLTDTIAIYTVVVGAFSPIVAIITYPSNVIMFLLMQRAKHANLPLNDAVSSIYTGLLNPPPDLVYVNYIGNFAATLFFLFVNNLVLAMLINLISRHYGAAKYRVVSASALMVVFFGWIPMATITPLYLFFLFVAIS